MDTSEQYIKMRLKAISDLGMGKTPEPMGAEEFYSFQTTTIFIDGKGDWYYSTIDEAVQLPRQDQLQEMVIDGRDTEKLLWAFARFVFVYDGDTFKLEGRPRRVLNNTFPPMEQLWLAFVMKEKYNKIWDGSSWIST